MKKSDFIFAGIVFCAAFAVFLVFSVRQPQGSRVRVYYNGKPVGEYSLAENLSREFSVREGVNTLTVEEGKAWISHADCPDRLCVKQGKIAGQGQSIVCLPHRLTVVIECGEEDAIDEVVG